MIFDKPVQITANTPYVAHTTRTPATTRPIPPSSPTPRPDWNPSTDCKQVRQSQRQLPGRHLPDRGFDNTNYRVNILLDYPTG
jgi:hypothetical protein